MSAVRSSGPVLVGSVLPPAISRDRAAEGFVVAAQRLAEAAADAPTPDAVAVRRLAWRLAQAHVLSGLVAGSLADALTVRYGITGAGEDVDRLVIGAREDLWTGRHRSEAAARSLLRARTRLGQIGSTR